jgi:AcrR family transcriptional regulator
MSPAAGSSDAESRILTAALDIFGSDGYSGGSLNDIAVAAGLTRAGVLHHFPSKRAILLALLDQRDHEVQASQPSSDKNWSLLDLFDDADRWTGIIVGNPRVVRLAHQLTAEASAPDHPAHEWVKSRLAALRAQIGHAARVSMERGEIRSDVAPDDVAALLLSAVEGSENQWLVDPQAVDVRAVQLVLRALLVTSA